MNAYTNFHLESSNASGIRDSQYIVEHHNRLSEPQLEFLNPGACQYVNPYSKTFWQDMKAWLSPISNQAANYPKSPYYRHALEPYLLRRVTITAESWHVQGISEFNGQLRLVLENVCLSHVHSNRIGAAPGIFVDHLNVWVSTLWLNHVAPDPIEPLTITGLLYEYVSKNTRNISVLPILLAPKNRKIGSYQSQHTTLPNILECSGISA